ncbi:MAG: hypothetical protein IJ784_09310 [Ruminiclostridium sp.]|nr:hypothetical protein [Ruminiclostridium sp.]
MDEKQRLVSLVNGSQEAMSRISAKENEIDNSRKWEARLTKYFHSPKVVGLISLVGRFFVAGFWLAVGITLSVILTAILTMIIPILPDWFITGLIVVFTGCLWLFPVYILPVILNFRTKKLQKELTALQQDPALEWLPMQYRTSFCFGKIAEYVQYERADSVKEAFSLLQREIEQLTVSVNNAILSSIM